MFRGAASHKNATEKGESRVNILVPKFQKNIGKKLCEILKKDAMFTARFDEIGSLVWQHCDGKTSVKEILATVEKRFPNLDNIDQRLILFLQQMHQLNYIQL